jgi:hypothetical protein
LLKIPNQYRVNILNALYNPPDLRDRIENEDNLNAIFEGMNFDDTRSDLMKFYNMPFSAAQLLAKILHPTKQGNCNFLIHDSFFHLHVYLLLLIFILLIVL